MLSFICLGIVAAYIVIQVVLFWGVAAFKEDDKKPIADAELPLLSLLVAARNEEQHIVQCLQALNELNYPKNNIQILVGNDQSEDATAALVIAFIKDKPQFKLLNITHTLGNARGKAMCWHILHKKLPELFMP